MSYTDPTGQIAISAPVEACIAEPEICAVVGAGIGVGSVILGHKATEELINAITGEGGEEVSVEEVEDFIECVEAEAKEKIPTGSKPPDRAYGELSRKTGLSKGQLSDALHKLKKSAGLRGADNTRVDSEGNVYDAETGEEIGNIIDEAHG